MKSQDQLLSNLITLRKFNFSKDNGDKNKSNNNKTEIGFSKRSKQKLEKIKKNKKFPASFLHLIK